jgi:hypothetical protein
MEEFKNIIQLSPPLALALALNVVGMAIKQTKLPDWTIVWVLPALGALIYPWIAVNTPTLELVRHPVVLNGIYGALIGAGSIGLNQLLRQTLATFTKKNNNGTPGSQPPAP